MGNALVKRADIAKAAPGVHYGERGTRLTAEEVQHRIGLVGVGGHGGIAVHRKSHRAPLGGIGDKPVERRLGLLRPDIGVVRQKCALVAQIVAFLASPMPGQEPVAIAIEGGVHRNVRQQRILRYDHRGLIFFLAGRGRYGGIRSALFCIIGCARAPIGGRRVSVFRLLKLCHRFRQRQSAVPFRRRRGTPEKTHGKHHRNGPREPCHLHARHLRGLFHRGAAKDRRHGHAVQRLIDGGYFGSRQLDRCRS